MQYGQIRELRRALGTAEEERELLQSEVRTLSSRHLPHSALGQIDLLGLQVSLLMHEYRGSDDALLQELSDDLWQLLLQAGQLKAKVLKAR